MPLLASELNWRALPEPLHFREDDPDGLTVQGLVVPYGVPTLVREPRPDGSWVSYREQFVAGSCDRAIRAPNRVPLNYTHDDGMPNRMGYGVSFTDTPGGLLGTFRLDRSRADHARDILTSSHSALSVGFRSVVPAPWTEREGALITRRSVVPIHVAAVPHGAAAYDGARVLAVRDDGLEGEPTAAELDDEARKAEDAALLAFFNADLANRWASLT